MLLKKRAPRPFSLLEKKKRFLFEELVFKIASRFQSSLGPDLKSAYHCFLSSLPKHFFLSRTLPVIRKTLLSQFFLQKKIEAFLKKEKNVLVVRLIKYPSSIGVAIASTSSFQKKELVQLLKSLLPGVQELPQSFYLFYQPDHEYFYTYFEVTKLRGKELLQTDLKKLEQKLKEHLLITSPLTPALFWPYNKEDSHRQIQILVKELNDQRDVAHISIQFQEQSVHSLQFLVHLVRPKQEQPIQLDLLPDSLSFFQYSTHEIHTPFSMEITVFSLKMPAHLFDVRDSINLLYARRYLIKQLELLIGEFRDFNGGLFEKQQLQFEELRRNFASKIPYFHHFAEKLFYALHPFEQWFFFTKEETLELFFSFSDLMINPRASIEKKSASSRFFFRKNPSQKSFLKTRGKEELFQAHAQIEIGRFQYECFYKPKSVKVKLKKTISSNQILRLAFQEGAPPSLNPHYSSSDMRSRILNKLLFEGLTRIDQQQKPVLAGASNVEISKDQCTYTFLLRESFWSNGERVSAEHYINSWKEAFGDFLSHPEFLFAFKNGKALYEKKVSFNELGIRIIDSQTLQIELEKPTPEFLSLLAHPFFFPLFESRKEPKWFNGPYLIQKMSPQGIKLDPNPYYPRKRAFEQIDIQWLFDVEKLFSLFLKKKIDWIGDPLSVLSAGQAKKLEALKLLKKQKVARRLFLFFQTNHPILQSELIRQAMSACIDQKWICEKIFPYSIPMQMKKTNPQKLFEKGLKELGLSSKQLPSLSFTFSDHTRRKELAEYLKKVWKKKLNLNVELIPLGWNEFRSRIEKKEFEICATIQDTLKEGSSEFLERFQGNSSYNFSGWQSPSFEKLLIKERKTKDLSLQKALKDEMNQLLEKSASSIPLFDYVHLYAFHSKLHSFSFDYEGCIDFT